VTAIKKAEFAAVLSLVFFTMCKRNELPMKDKDNK